MYSLLLFTKINKIDNFHNSREIKHLFHESRQKFHSQFTGVVFLHSRITAIKNRYSRVTIKPLSDPLFTS